MIKGLGRYGSWGTPEFGLTELLQRILQPGNTNRPGGGSNLLASANDFSRARGWSPSGETLGATNNRPPVRTPPQEYNYDSNGTRVTQDANVRGGDTIDEEVRLAEIARRNRIDSYKAQAGTLRDEGQSTFDNILKAVNAFRDRSGVLRDNAGQEITNRASGILGENARTSRDLEGETRAKGRAFGLGDSSKFINQNKLAGNLAATQGNTIARRGEEERSNQNLFQTRQDEAQGQENEANSYIKNVRDRATSIENLGYDAGEEQFANSLNDIVNYQRSLAAINPLNAGGINAYNPNFSGITNTINDVVGSGGGGTSNADDFSNPVNPTNIFELLRRRGLIR